jgi:hypothetical protein
MRFLRNLAWLALGVSVVAGIAMAAEEKPGPDVIKIDTNSKGKHVPAFPHHRHMENPDLKGQCKKCHHTAKPREKLKKCGACHTLVKDKNPETNAPGFKNAFHGLCQKCHKLQKEKPYLKKCKTCHPKK